MKASLAILPTGILSAGIFCAGILCAGVTTAGSAFAQGGRQKPVFDTPEKPDSERDPSGDEAAEAADGSLQNTLSRLAGWPQERARRAAERLIIQKERSLQLVREILVDNADASDALKPGAAYVLGRIGEKSDYLTLLLVAAEKKQQRHASTFLEAAAELNEEETVKEAFRFFAISETTLRREAVDFVRNRVTKENLPAILDLMDARQSERSYTREIGLVLLDRLVATEQVPWSEAGPRFYRMLGDDAPNVAARAMRICASDPSEGNVAELNGLISKEYSNWRQRSYAALSLSLLSSAFKLQPCPPETIEVLRGERGLRHRTEMLAQASAALLLAQVAMRTGDPDLVRLLDREIPIVLIEAVGASNRHYRDFGSVVEYAYAMLRRITGQNFPDQAPVWATWWRDHGRRFRARRELVRIEAEDLPDTVLEITPPAVVGGEPLRFLAISSLRPTFVHGTAYALTTDDLQKSAQFLTESGFFDRPEADPADVQPSDLLVVVRVGDLARTVTWGLGEGEAALRDALLARFTLLAEENAWQLWQDLLQQPSWELFFAENSRWFREHHDPAERTARLREMITASFSSLSGTDLKLRAVRALDDLPGGASALTEEQVRRVTRAVWTEPEANEFTAAVVQFVVPILTEEEVPTVVEALAEKVGPIAQNLLVRLFESLPAERTASFAADARWKVRRAAVDALGKADTLPPAAREALAGRLQDEEVLVRMSAAEALGRRKDPSILPALETLAGDRAGDVRAAAAFAYGLLATDEAREKIGTLLFRDPSNRVRERAIQGLAEGGDPRAVPLLLKVFRDEPELNVRAAAASAIVRLETPAVVDQVVSRLELSSAASPERVALVNVLARFESPRVIPLLRMVLQGDDPISADAAALGLARRWDDGAMGQLIRMLENGRSQRAAVRHLQQLTSRAFETEDYERQAENYKAWYAANATGNPRVWFREALAERGYDAGALQGWSEGAGTTIPPVPDAAVPMLLRVLRDKDPYLQINASLLLDMRLGDAAPDAISWLSTRDEAERAIRAYVDWWAERSREKEALERG